MAKSSKSATLPPNLRHHPPKQEENETFFSKLKKRFKLKKGKYHVDVGSGDCENVSAVSFKKRTSSELLDPDSPLKHGLGRSSERTSRSESPKSNKTATRSLSERFVVGQISNRPTHERKHSNPTYSDGRYPQMSSSEFVTTSKSNMDMKSSKSDNPYKGNEYSVMKFSEKDDTNYKTIEKTIENNRIRQLEAGDIQHDDSAIDLDHFETENINPHVNDNGHIHVDPGYERQPADQKKENNKNKVNKGVITPTSPNSVSSFEFDPHYESVHDVKQKLKQSNSSTMASKTVTQVTSKSIESLDDPRYQSINEVKHNVVNKGTDSRKPAKTYDVSKSIESLDEPGYESLNDVKKRISEHFGNNASVITNDIIEQSQHKESTTEVTGNLNDSAVSFSMVNESMTASKGQQNEEKSLDLSASQDSGFGSRNEKTADEPDCLYSTVKKKSLSEDVQANDSRSTESIQTKDESKNKKQIADHHDNVKDGKHVTSEGPGEAAQPLVPVDHKADDYDSETELVMDPGYAECADAIKGIPPYQPFSDGSESKISSCTSLDLSVEDFPPEPGYAECADAIKSGAIKKISISREKLIIEEDVIFRKEESAEIYANPQILFKKRSKNLESGSSDLSSPRMSLDVSTDIAGSSESLKRNSVINLSESTEQIDKNDNKGAESNNHKKEAESSQSSPEAPPLPARNYSLYLDNDEAAQLIPDDDKLSGSDDAFELDGEVSESASNVCKQLDRLSNSPVEQEVVRTHSEAFEVHEEIGTGLSENTDNIQDLENISETQIITKNVGEDENAKNDSENVGEVNNAEIEIGNDTAIEKNGNLNERSETTVKESVDTECVHVTVYDKEGNTKVLTVIDKQPSQRSGSKRVKTDNSPENAPDISPELCEPCETSAKNQGDIQCHNVKQDVNGTNVDNVENVLSVENSTGNLNDTTYQGGIVSDSFKSAANILSESNNKSSLSSSSSHEVIDTNQIDTNTNKADSVINEDKQNVVKDSLSPTETVNVSETVNVNRCTSLEVVKPVKMQSISWDSDEEFQGSELLPKLEIVESDQDVFENSDSSGKLVSDSPKAESVDNIVECVSDNTKNASEATKIESVDTCNTVECASDNMENASNIVGCTSSDDTNKTPDAKSEDLTLFELPVTNFSAHVPDSVSNEQGVPNEGLDEVDSGCFDSVVTDAVSFPHTEVEIVATAHEAFIDQNVQNDQNTQELLGNLDCMSSVNEQMAIQSDIMCNSETELRDGRVDNDQLEPQSAEVAMWYYPPSWYKDTEPTHMSLTEIMTLSSASDSVLLFNNNTSSKGCANQTDCDGLSNSYNENENSDLSQSLNNLPSTSNQTTTTPPPRPPSYTAGQSRDRYSSSSQSGQSCANSPLDDTLPGFRFAEPTHSDVDDPPAIPPRSRYRRVHQRRDSSSQDFMESMRQLKDCGWYWGPLSWEEAEQKLANKPEGTFLVRDSSDERYILSLSFKNQGRVHHTRIEHHRGHFSFWSQPDSHGKSTIKEFIEQCVHNSENGRFLYFIRPSGPGSPPLPIHLLYPVSRFVQMRSLQHMCRFRILQMVRRDHIDNLPVPTRIKQYLKEAQYYVEYLDD